MKTKIINGLCSVCACLYLMACSGEDVKPVDEDATTQLHGVTFNIFQDGPVMHRSIRKIGTSGFATKTYHVGLLDGQLIVNNYLYGNVDPTSVVNISNAHIQVDGQSREAHEVPRSLWEQLRPEHEWTHMLKGHQVCMKTRLHWTIIQRIDFRNFVEIGGIRIRIAKKHLDVEGEKIPVPPGSQILITDTRIQTFENNQWVPRWTFQHEPPGPPALP